MTSIWFLYASLIVAIVLTVLTTLIAIARVVEYRHASRHARRRAKARRGYLPVYDNEYEPFHAGERWR